MCLKIVSERRSKPAVLKLTFTKVRQVDSRVCISLLFIKFSSLKVCFISLNVYYFNIHNLFGIEWNCVALKPKSQSKNQSGSKVGGGRVRITHFLVLVMKAQHLLHKIAYANLRKRLQIGSSCLMMIRSCYGFQIIYQTRMTKQCTGIIEHVTTVVDDELLCTSKRSRRSSAALSSVFFSTDKCLFCNL